MNVKAFTHSKEKAGKQERNSAYTYLRIPYPGLVPGLFSPLQQRIAVPIQKSKQGKTPHDHRSIIQRTNKQNGRRTKKKK